MYFSGIAQTSTNSRHASRNDEAGPGRLFGRGSLTIGFDSLVLPDAVTLPMAVKVIAAPKCKVSPDGRIMGKGHAKRDAVG